MSKDMLKSEEYWTTNLVDLGHCEDYQVYQVDYVDEARGILLKSPVEAIWTEWEGDVCVVKYRHPVKGECRLSEFGHKEDAIACVKAIIQSRMWYKK